MKKILIVDDDPNLTLYLRNKLIKAGHEVITESNGILAINRLMDFTPDIIFVDYFLPNINGDLLCKIIRKIDHLKDSYLVLMSAAAKELQFDQSNMCPNAFIAKGIFSETLKYFLSAIEDSDKPLSDRQGFGVMGIESVAPRRMTVELLGKYRHLQTMLDSITDGVVEVLNGQIVYTNPAAVAILGKKQDQLLAAHPLDLFDESEKPKVAALMESQDNKSEIIQLKMPMQAKNKVLSVKKLPLKAGSDTIIIMITDITEQVYTEEALRKYQDRLESLVEERTAALNRTSEKLQQAQKMEAIGIIAGCVAHDLNNILTSIVAYPDLMLLQLPEESPLRKMVMSIQESGKKAAAIVQDLLTMARRGVVTNEVVNLNAIISQYLNSPECEKLKLFHPEVHIMTNLEKNILNILGSPIHISKTLMNLVSNAAEAMHSGGKILITTENRYLDGLFRTTCGNEEVREGDYAALIVSDSGVGISPDDLGRIFEPFYTKKQMGRSGTGLGMTVVWGTVKDHNGYIEVKSDIGKGTAFILYFPATRQELTKKSLLPPLEEFKGKGESILVVDDTEEQRLIISIILTTLCYSVTAVSSGEEAVEYIKNNHADLVILDMSMEPGIDGLETYRLISELRPHQKAIIASGYSETERISASLSLGVGQYIKKPYTLEKIGIAVRQELDKKMPLSAVGEI